MNLILRIFPVIALLALSSPANANRFFTDVDLNTIEPSSALGTAAAFAIAANAGDYAACEALMDDKLVRFFATIGGTEEGLRTWRTVDLGKRFAYRSVVEGNTANFNFRVFSRAKNREINIRIMLAKTDTGWKVTL